jgi:hypothetical protein
MSQLLKTWRGGIGIALLSGIGLATGTSAVARGADPAAKLDPLTSVQPESTPTTLPTRELAEPYTSAVGGISLRPPKGMRLLVRLDQKVLAQWADESSTLVVRRIKLVDATPLTTERHAGVAVAGVLEIALDRLQTDLPGAKVLRKDLTVVPTAEPTSESDPDPDPDEKTKPNVGLIVVRYSSAGVSQLKQQALIRANHHLYYLVEYTTPGNKVADEKAADDPNIQAAVDTFGRMLDTVRLLDTSKVREEQEKSIFATLAFSTNLTPAKLRSMLVPEQWFRILINGKDVGYTYVMEQTAGGLPQPDEDTMKRAHAGELNDEEKRRPFLMPKLTPGDDILIGVKSRLIIDGVRANKTRGEIQTDSESWMFVTADRKHEDWSRLIVEHDATRPKDHWSEEVGTSDQHLVGLKEGASLTVTQVTNSGNLPAINQEVPRFYIPGAIAQLIPRLLDLKSQKQYVFASFIGEQRAVEMRYFRLEPPQEVELDGVATKVIPVSDRIGFDGPQTLHYLSVDADAQGRHRYLGSENKQTGTLVLVSDQAALEKIFTHAGDARRTSNAAVQGPPVPTPPDAPGHVQQ